MAQAGATEEELLHFSGHKTRQTLYRYLYWGQVQSANAVAAARRSEALMPRTH